jgi:hypothetical protein
MQYRTFKAGLPIDEMEVDADGNPPEMVRHATISILNV